MSQGRDRTRLLIVDDHPTYAQGLRALLELQGAEFQTEATSRPEEALEIVARDAPEVALVDVRMPRVGGVELAARIREMSPSTRVLMLTISEEAEDVRASLRAGAVGYLSKDLGPEQVAAAAALGLAGHFVLSKLAFDVVTAAFVEDSALSRQERTLIELAAGGAPLDQIADHLAVSRATATRMLARLQRRFGVANRDQLVAFAARRGWV